MLSWTYRALRWTLGGIFIYAGWSKLMDLEIFAVLIEAFGIVPNRLLIPVAFGLSVLEVIAGILLILDIRGGLELIAGLLIVFMAVLVYGIWMGLDVDCGCFGPEDPEARAFHGLRQSLYRDLVMLAGVGFIYCLRWYYAIRPVNIRTIMN